MIFCRQLSMTIYCLIYLLLLKYFYPISRITHSLNLIFFFILSDNFSPNILFVASFWVSKRLYQNIRGRASLGYKHDLRFLDNWNDASIEVETLHYQIDYQTHQTERPFIKLTSAFIKIGMMITDIYLLSKHFNSNLLSIVHFNAHYKSIISRW